MDRQLLVNYREGWQAVEMIEQSENKHASIAQRWLELNTIYNLAVDLGLVFEENRDQENIVWQRWSKLKNTR